MLSNDESHDIFVRIDIEPPDGALFFIFIKRHQSRNPLWIPYGFELLLFVTITLLSRVNSPFLSSLCTYIDTMAPIDLLNTTLHSSLASSYVFFSYWQKGQELTLWNRNKTIVINCQVAIYSISNGVENPLEIGAICRSDDDDNNSSSNNIKNKMCFLPKQRKVRWMQ